MGWCKSTGAAAGGSDSNIYKSDGSHTEDSEDWGTFEDSHSSESPTTQHLVRD